MRRKNIKESLTLRIFLITCLILLAASAVTYGVVALATPITYTALITSHFKQQAAELPARLEQTAFEDCGPVLDQFISDTGATVMIVDDEGEIVNTPSNLSVSVIYESENMVISVSPSEEQNIYQSVTVHSGAEEAGDNLAVSSDSLTYPFSFQGQSEVNLLYISPSLEKANQTIQALGRVAPWLLAVILIFSVLCSLFYSRYITRPIVKLSAVSQRMARLDFGWKCQETRSDEIGVLGRSLNELSERLSEALTGLKDANAALQRDMDRERERESRRLAFFSAVSHELKTPVTILKGQLEGMLEGVDVYQDRDKYLAKALQVTGRMEGLVQEVLTVSRMEHEDAALHMDPLDLAELTRQCLALYDDLILQKGMRLETSLPRSASIEGDAALLKKVLDNLLSNAVFYAPEGASLSVRLEADGPGWVLSVENSGSHIPEDALGHVFEAFYRGETSRNRRTGGSGLGLYIVRMILERHGAAYRIENTESGVCFNVRF